MKKKIILLLLIYWFLPVHANAQLAGTYIVGHSSGADFNSLSEVSNALTSNQIVGPTIFNIEPGIYYEHLVIKDILGATAINRIVFQPLTGNPNDVWIRQDPASSGSNYTIKFDGARHITFKNITITSDSLSSTSNSYYGTAVQIRNGSYDLKIYNNTIIGKVSNGTGNTNAVVYSDGLLAENFIEIRNNRIFNGSYGILLDGNTASSEIGNNISSNRISGFNTAGIKVSRQFNINIEKNVLNGLATGSDIKGIQCDQISVLYIRGNNINLSSIAAHTDFSGITINNCRSLHPQEALVYNNYFSQISGSGTTRGFSMISCNNISFVFNTIRIKTTPVGSLVYIDGVDSSGSVILNNNLVHEANGMGFEISQNAFTNHNLYQSNFNNIFTNDTLFAKVGGVIIDSLNEWNALTGFDAASIKELPIFGTDSTSHCVGSLLNNNATPLDYIYFDIDDQPRNPTTPDIGADEFSFKDLSILGNNSLNNFCIHEPIDISAIIRNDGASLFHLGDTVFVKTLIDSLLPIVDTIVLGNDLFSGDSLFFNKTITNIFTTSGIKNYKIILSNFTDEWVFNDTLISNFYINNQPEWAFQIDTFYTSNPDTITLSAPNIFNSYLWSTGDTTNYLNIQNYGIYSLTISNGFCMKSDTVVITTPLKNSLFIKQENELWVYPNPAQTFILINIPVQNLGNTRNNNCQIFNTEGLKIFEHTFFDSTFYLDIRDLENGMYHLRVIDNNNVYNLSIIKF